MKTNISGKRRLDGDTKVVPVTIATGSVREALEAILRSADLAESVRLKSFLSYVVEETIAGRSSRIKWRGIAEDVFGRNTSVDTPASTQVRVEAGRLRRRLEHYYLTDGRDDPVRIEIRKGSYIPVFTPRDIAVETAVKNNTDSTAAAPNPKQTLVVLDKPVVAVLPFENLSDGAKSDRLNDGVTEDIIAGLSKISDLGVIARTSTLFYRDNPMPVQRIAKDLGVTHVLEGSVRAIGNRVRIICQLIDCANGHHAWAERYDRDLSDIFALQVEIANRVVAALSVELAADEKERLRNVPTQNLESFLLYVKAMDALFDRSDAAPVLTARKLFEQVVALDPQFGGGYVGISWTYWFSYFVQYDETNENEAEQVRLWAQKAHAVDSSFGLSHSVMALSHITERQFDAAMEETKRSLKLNPGDSLVLNLAGVVAICVGECEAAIESLKLAFRLNPGEHRRPYLNVLGVAYGMCGQWDLALEMFEASSGRSGPLGPISLYSHAAALCVAGRTVEARLLIETVELLHAGFSFKGWLGKHIRKTDQARTVLRPLRKVGLYG